MLFETCHKPHQFVEAYTVYELRDNEQAIQQINTYVHMKYWFDFEFYYFIIAYIVVKNLLRKKKLLLLLLLLTMYKTISLETNTIQ